MRIGISKALLIGILLITGISQLPVRAAQNQNPLTNQDIIRMVENALPESVILSAIQAGPTNFDTSVDALIALHKAGASKKVMDAMMAAGANRQQQVAPPPASSTPTATSAPPATTWPATGTAVQAPTVMGSGPGSPMGPTQGPTIMGSGGPGSGYGMAAGAPVGIPGAPVAGGVAPALPVPGEPSVQLLPATPAAGTAVSQAALPMGTEKTQLAETKAKPTSMTSLASDSALTQALQAGVTTATTEVMTHSTSMAANNTLMQAGSIFSNVLAHHKPSVTYVWALSGPASTNSLNTSNPRFGVDLSQVPGINPEDFEPAIVKLTPSQNAWRLVGATQGKEDARSNSVADWQIYSGFLEDRVTVTSRKLRRASYEITPVTPLLPGEYGVVMRPISKNKKFSGGDVARNQGDGMMFNCVWSFQVAPGARP